MTSVPDPHGQFDPTLQSENIAFAQADLIDCKGCGRKNAPDRAACLYCGQDLENSRATKLDLRKLESWEPGFNVIARKFSEGADLDAIGRLLAIDKQRLEDMPGVGQPLPLVRVDSLSKANAILDRLAGNGCEALVIADEALDPETPPVRLKRIDTDENELILIDLNNDNVYRLDPDDVLLLVTGSLISSRTDVLEKRKRGGKVDLLDEMSTGTDESVLDIYATGNDYGFRIRLSGFDFSCLSGERSLIASENFRLLIEHLTSIATNATVVDYMSVRGFLDDVWEPEVRRDTQGIVSAGLGKKGFGSVATTNNVTQFTKFSRMHWRLLSSI